jgi:LPS-assembly protein
VLEPVLMLGWVGGRTAAVPNEESTRVEFDEGNLLSLARFPAADRREHGRAMAYGVNWARTGQDGWRMALTLGQVVRDDALADFTRSSGLAGTTSAILFAGQVQHRQGFAFQLRSMVNPTESPTKAEARLAWHRPDFGLSASYVWLGQDVAEARPDVISEWSLYGYRRLGKHWIGTTNWRYDVASDQTAQAGFGLQYRNECVALNLTVARRYTVSTIVAPSTDFGFTVSLGGFGVHTGDASYTRACRL